jgi:hypothetical protein
VTASLEDRAEAVRRRLPDDPMDSTRVTALNLLGQFRGAMRAAESSLAKAEREVAKQGSWNEAPNRIRL